jgi:ATP-dependent protease Clp ATPase subunit
MNKLIVILGPTASGKTDLSIKLAKKYNGEVVSADSRQIYKGMDIGRGKVTKKEMEGIPHHLLDVANPKTRFSVAQYQKLAFRVVLDSKGIFYAKNIDKKATEKVTKVAHKKMILLLPTILDVETNKMLKTPPIRYTFRR